MRRFFGFGFCLCLASCSADKAPLPEHTTLQAPIDSTRFTYILRIKPILDANCALPSCHTTQDHADRIITDTYAGAVQAFAQRDALCAIEWQTGCKGMPILGKMADTLIQSCAVWQAKAYPQ